MQNNVHHIPEPENRLRDRGSRNSRSQRRIREAQKYGYDKRRVIDSPLYSLPPDQNGQFSCPWSADPKCSHQPTTRPSTYRKYIDAHLSPYRCQQLGCEDLTFASVTTLYRHTRGHLDQLFCDEPGCKWGPHGTAFRRADDRRDHMKRAHKRTQSAVLLPPTGSTSRDSNEMTHSFGPPLSSDSATMEIKKEDQGPKNSRTQKACAACRARRTRCQNERPCEPCVRRNLVCRERSPTMTRRSVDKATETSLEDFASTGNERLSDVSDPLDLSPTESPVTPGSEPTQTKFSLDGPWKLEIYSELGSPLVLRPGSKIARLSRESDEERHLVQVPIQNDSPTFQGRRYLELWSTYEFSRVDDGTIQAGWRPETGVKFGFCAGSTASLPWVYEILLRYPNNFLASDDDELSQLFKAVSQLHELEFESVCSRGFSLQLFQLRSFQFYHTALCLQWRERGLMSYELMSSRHDKPRIKSIRMISEWVHILSFTHVHTDGSLRRDTTSFSSIAELVRQGWSIHGERA